MYFEKIAQDAFKYELEKISTGLSADKILSAVNKRYGDVAKKLPSYKNLLKNMHGVSKSEIGIAMDSGASKNHKAIMNAIGRVPKTNPKHSILF